VDYYIATANKHIVFLILLISMFDLIDLPILLLKNLIHVNVVGTTKVTHAVLPGILKRKKGQLLILVLVLLLLFLVIHFMLFMLPQNHECC
jgi:hypothetical protein